MSPNEKPRHHCREDKLSAGEATLPRLEHLLDGTRSERAPQVASVLIQCAMRDEDDAPALLIAQPLEQQLRSRRLRALCPLEHRTRIIGSPAKEFHTFLYSRRLLRS